MNRPITDATTKRHPSDGHEPLRTQLELVLDACHHTPRLKTSKGLTPAQLIRNEWQSRPELFHNEPCHRIAGMNT